MLCRSIWSLRQLIRVRKVQGIDQGIELLPTIFRYSMFLLEMTSDAIVICL
jgi:hypothetical protein